MTGYEAAKAKYEALGVDTDRAIERVKKDPVSLHCWQLDDVIGFDNDGGLTGGIQTTGNYPGRARTPQQLMEDMEEAMKLMPGTKGAIGYVGLAYLSPRVKAIAVSYDDGKHYVLPSLENGKKKLYPVVRPLYYYYNVANKEKVTPFIEYILSPQGQNIIKNGGYIPVK